MTEGAVQLLKEAYGVSGSAVQVIPHGVPEVAFQRDERLKGRLGQAGKKVICTFGLLSRSKGIEYMIRAMPHIVAACPEAVYWIVGVTHPQVKRQEGEIYREELMDLVESLGVRNHVRFVNKYLGTAELLAHLQASDIFVTPYVGEDQISSGPMACAMSAVGAVISTPYLFAKEVLADGRGLLIPFADSQALAEAALKLLTDPALLLETRRKTYQFAKSMVWPLVGQQYLECFTQAAADQPYRTSLPPSGRILRREFSPRGM